MNEVENMEESKEELVRRLIKETLAEEDGITKVIDDLVDTYPEMDDPVERLKVYLYMLNLEFAKLKGITADNGDVAEFFSNLQATILTLITEVLSDQPEAQRYVLTTLLSAISDENRDFPADLRRLLRSVLESDEDDGQEEDEEVDPTKPNFLSKWK